MPTAPIPWFSRSAALSVSYVAGGLVATAAYFMLPKGGLLQALLFLAIDVAILAAIIAGVLVRRPTGVRFWIAMIASQALYLAAYLIWYVYPVALQITLPFPSIADGFFMGSYAVSAVALLMLIRSRSSASHNRADLLDAGIMTLGIAAVSWVYLIAPNLQATQLDLAGRLVSATYPLMDVVLIACAIRLAVTPGARTPAHWLLIAWIACQFIADSAYAVDLLRHGTFAYGSPYFAGWMLSLVFLGAAALHPSMRHVTRGVDTPGSVAPRRRLLLVLGASLVPSILTLLDLRDGVADDAAVLAAMTILLFILAAMRMSDLMLDIAAHRRLQLELERSNAELEQFAYVASHDLQEPLRMVASYTGLLKRRYQGRLDTDADEFIAYAVDGVTRMQALINDLLAYSRAGRQPRPREVIDAAQPVRRALDNLEAAIGDRNALVTIGPLPRVLANPMELTQLFQNLIGNAVKFCRDERPQVLVGAELRGSEWTFFVRDNGIGIDPHYQARIFLIFQRLHKRDEYAGTGIGLAICKKIVERNGGRIWVESEAGKGATFYFTLQRLEATGGLLQAA